MPRRGRTLPAVVCAIVIGVAPGVSGQQPARPDPVKVDLARARVAYNARNFDEAIAAATAARRVPEVADAAAIVLGRAHLERYRERADPADLSAAREVLGTVRTMGLDARDQVELLLAFGEALFLEDEFGAAAEVFESGVIRAAIDLDLRESMLEWWGSAVERLASAVAPDERRRHFARLAERMQGELAKTPASAAAGYWTVVALRGAGDLQRAWDAAVAAWVRARLTGDQSANLRADLDRVVTQGIIPDRVGPMAAEQREKAAAQLRANWELLKARWK
jgi:hypothetical protein